MSLGSLLGFLRLSWEALRVKKCRQSHAKKKHLFVNAVFWLFAAPNGSLGLILVRLGRIWFQNGFPKVFQNVIKSLSKNDQKNEAHRVPKWVPKKWLIEIAGLRHFLPWVQFFKTFILCFSLGFGALWLPLGSLLGSLEALLGSLWTQKRVKTKCFSMVLKRLFFGL